MDVKSIEDSLMARYYAKKPITIDRGFMQYVWDSSGRKYLDAHTGFGAAFLGHRNPPRIIKALTEQMNRVITVPLTMYSEARLSSSQGSAPRSRPASARFSSRTAARRPWRPR